MNQKEDNELTRQPTTIICRVLIAFCLMLSENPLQAQSEVTDTGLLSMTVSLVGSSTVSLGEPVLLKYVVKNSSEQTVSMYTKDVKRNSLITECFIEAGGKPLAPSVSRLIPGYKTEVLRAWDGLSFIGNDSRSWEALANPKVTFPRTGSYVLRVHAQNPYVVGDIDQGAHYTLIGDYAFPLKVVAAKPGYLHDTAERLRGRIWVTTDVETKATLIQALFSMPEADAAASWQSLIGQPKLDGMALNEIATALADLLTIKGADLLAEMFWNPVQSPDDVAAASVFQHLYEMYDSGDPALRKHIEDLYKQHGVAMSHYRLE